ncbi:amidase signature domain-containing protein [Nemania abortiva]|nr:amidase signature domain-containing protein [Nemania abortiva]
MKTCTLQVISLCVFMYWAFLRLTGLISSRKPLHVDMSAKRNFDILTTTAGDVRRLLESGETTSVDLVKKYLEQIAKHNLEGMKLNAIIATAPVDSVLEEAQALDKERVDTGPRSKLHGIPIILKDLICTGSLEMETTAGSLALKGLKASADATITVLLRNAGCIVIGKSNLSEWANSKGINVTSGWSAVGGQTLSPYVKGGINPKDRWMGHSTPAGSSSGSAVAAAAGFAPLCIGTEADGSIVQPAIRAALYSIKGTVGDVDMVGTQSGGAAFDSAGPLAKSVEDCADVMDILLPGRDFHTYLKKSWQGIKIAYLNYDAWQFPDSVCEKTPAFDEEHKMAMDEAMKKAESLGAKVTLNAQLMSISNITQSYNTVTQGQIGRHQLAPVIKRFLAIFNEPTMRTLEDVVEFNKKHAAEELPPDQPSQQVLENGLTDDMTDSEYHEGLRHLRESTRDAVERCLEQANADVIMASGESVMTTIAANAGYPIASVPLGFSSYNGRPFGMEIMARNAHEGKIFEVMSAWEATFPEGRMPPPMLVNKE